ncbi:hypothetical protein QAD02_021649 [Eretmocerus hayati]|uniref:Uncharacterized protein n=1 Tax=Eretmocerus hayati TaxID=131215 RepID=A0ACC2PSQ0_9HYME|nr:hypothetical protein QAD02_021649 [Eretmocerus hayati]
MEAELKNILNNWNLASDLEELIRLFEFQKSRRIFKLLYRTFQGKTILYHYAKTGDVLRVEYSRIVIDEKLNNSLSNPVDYLTIRDERMDALFDETTQVFKNEMNKAAYTEKGLTLSGSNTTVRRRSGGCFWNAADILFNTARFSGLKDVKPVNTIKNPPKSVPATSRIDLSIFEEKEPPLATDELKKLWLAACSHKYSVIYPKLSFAQITGKFASLTGEVAPHLVGVDFLYILAKFKNKVDEYDKFKLTAVEEKLKKHWPRLASTIVQIAIDHNNEAVNTKKTVIPIPIEEEHFGKDGYKETLAWLLMPHLIKHSFRRKVFADWKPTLSESIECFVRHSETDCDDEVINSDESETEEVSGNELESASEDE